MTTEQQHAYDWAKNQSYPSVAAQYAKTLVGLVDNLHAEAEFHRDDSKHLLAEWKKAAAQRDSLEALIQNRIRTLKEYQPKSLIDRVNTDGVLALLEGTLAEWEGTEAQNEQ